MKNIIAIGVVFAAFTLGFNIYSKAQSEAAVKLTPQDVLNDLKQGNIDFLNGNLKEHDHKARIAATSFGQAPEAAVLGCIDSRVPPELAFDQGIGDIFTARVAGNLINPDILGSLEYSTHVVGAKVIVVLGHTNCGAVKSSCEEVKLGHITQLLDKIYPAVQQMKNVNPSGQCNDTEFINFIEIQHVKNVVKEMPQNSEIIANLVNSGDLIIVGAMYDASSGKVTFLD